MPPTRTALCLVRHGQTAWNRDGRWQGHADPDLTAEALEASRAFARELAVEHAVRPWTRLISSDLARARSTASLLGDLLALRIELDARLRELDVGRWSGLIRSEIEARDGETLRAFERGDPSVRPGGGETRVEIRERSHAFVCDLLSHHAGERVLVVTHLGVIRALVPGAQPGNLERFELWAEDLAAQPIDRAQRPERGPL